MKVFGVLHSQLMPGSRGVFLEGLGVLYRYFDGSPLLTNPEAEFALRFLFLQTHA